MTWRERLTDPLRLIARAKEAAQSEREHIRRQVTAEAIQAATRYVIDNPEAWANRVSEVHTTEMSWRARQNFYDITGKTTTGKVSEKQRRKDVARSRLHIHNDPLYIRAVSLTADFIFGKGVSAPRAAGEGEVDEKGKPKEVDAEVKKVAGIADDIWHDPMNLRVWSSTNAQIERGRQLLIDGEVPWLLFVNEGGFRWWPHDSICWVDYAEHPEMPGVPMLYQRQWTEGTETHEKWYWSTEARPMVEDNPDTSYEDLVAKIKKRAKISDRQWADSDLDREFETGPYVYFWSWRTDPLAVRGHPPFFAAMDWGEVNVGLAGSLQTYVKSITAITGILRGQLTAGDLSTLNTNIASTLSLDKPPPGTGTWFASGTGQELKMMDVPTGGAELFKVGYEISRLMVSAATGIPVHWLGDPSTGNLATATAMELAQLKMFEGWQRWFTGQYDEMFRIAARFATGKDYDTASMLEIDFPELVSRDVFQMLQALATAKNANLMSDEDAARQTARQLGEDDIEAFVKRAIAEPEEPANQLMGMFEHEPDKALRMIRKAERELREKQKD